MINMRSNVYNLFRDYNKEFRITSSKIIFPQEVYEEIVKNTKGNVLDIGTADGYKLENILNGVDQDKINKIVAIDPSPLYKKAESRLRKLKKVEVCNLCLEDLNSEEKFDTILMFEIIEHVPNFANVMEKITGLLKPNGIFICSTPNKWIYRITERMIEKKPDSTHVNEMTSKQFISLMDSHFHETRYMGVLPFMTIGRRFPHILVLNRYFSFIPVSRTIYCFARKSKVFK